MAHYTKKAAGQSPGTLVHIGKKKVQKVNITIVDYNKDTFKIKETENIQDITETIPANTYRWINITGLHDINLIGQIGECFNLHPIALENVLNTMHKTGLDDYDDYIHIVANLAYWNKKQPFIETDQLSIIFGKNYLITFIEQERNIFEPLIRRLQNTKSKARKFGVSYLAYCILDLAVDNFFVVIEDIEGKIELLEKDIIDSPKPEILKEIQELKHNLIFLRKTIWPYREIVNNLQNTDSDLISSNIDIYLKNLYDHSVQAISIIETFRDIVSGILDIYLSSISNEMNKVMKVLTIIATIFIPITFIAGVYGMNFDTKSPFNMPELSWHYGYPFSLGLMATIVLIMIFYFKKKKWF